MDKQTEQLEAELRQMKPAAADSGWEESVRRRWVDIAPRRPVWIRRVIPIAAAACLALIMIMVFLDGDGQEKHTTGDPAMVAPSGGVTIASGWRIEPTGKAVFKVVDDGRIELERGELLVFSVAAGDQHSPTQDLTIRTPEGEARAAGTRFYIGTHENSSKGPDMHRFTRVLVLAGVVTLTNAMGSVTGNANDLLAADSEQSPSKYTVQANSDFAIDLYRRLAKENKGGNLFFSPYSVSGALAMTAEGARGETADEMGKVLRYPKAAMRTGVDAQLIPWRTSLIHNGFQQINAKLKSDPDDPKLKALRKKITQLRAQLTAAKAETAAALDKRDFKNYNKLAQAERKIADEVNKAAAQVDQFELNVANALWGQKGFRIEQPFRDAIAKHYDTGAIEEADFAGQTEGERVRINNWVEDQTRNRIKDLIPPGGITRLTRLVLVNAIYFKGEWQTPFKENMTRPIDFTLSDGKKIKTATMQANGLGGARYGAFDGKGQPFKTPRMIRRGQKESTYPDKDGFLVAELPYKGKELSMVLIAPMEAGKLGDVEQKLSAASITKWMGALEGRELHVKLPKLKLETDYKLGEGGMNPSGTLPDMGMKRAFTDPRAKEGADFTGMHDTSNLMQRLYIGKVFHKAFLEVNEKGTEAAAATAVVMVRPTSAPISVKFTPTFSADRPFILMIRHKETGAILFMGRVTNPTLNS